MELDSRIKLTRLAQRRMPYFNDNNIFKTLAQIQIHEGVTYWHFRGLFRSEQGLKNDFFILQISWDVLKIGPDLPSVDLPATLPATGLSVPSHGRAVRGFGVLAPHCWVMGELGHSDLKRDRRKRREEHLGAITTPKTQRNSVNGFKRSHWAIETARFVPFFCQVYQFKLAPDLHFFT